MNIKINKHKRGIRNGKEEQEKKAIGSLINDNDKDDNSDNDENNNHSNNNNHNVRELEKSDKMNFPKQKVEEIKLD